MKPLASPNFDYLGYHDPRLAEVATRAERVLGLDPVAALGHLRLFGELLAKNAAARLGVYGAEDETQLDRLRMLSRQGLPANILQMLHSLRQVGNRAVHDGEGTQQDAFTQLKLAFQLAIWFQRSFGSNRKFDPGPLVPPVDIAAQTDELRSELLALREQAEAHRAEVEALRRQDREEAERLLGAEEVARKAREEAEVWAALAEESEARQAKDQAALKRAQAALEALERKHEEALKQLQAAAEKAPPQQTQELVNLVSQAAAAVELDEAGTRALIDEQLRAAGWEVDTKTLRYSEGVRPQKHRNLAIAEWPTNSGPADYVLFVGLEALGVVEAKKIRVDVSAALEQSKRYSRGFRAGDGAELAGGPWGEYRVPFLFSTNGRPYLKQLETKSGIWFLDARRPQNISGPQQGWYSPEGLKKRLEQDVDVAQAKLAHEPTDYLGLREYQVRAIKAVEAAVGKGARSCLVAMATGTGKTRTAIGLVYRLIKSQRFRRVLFLVDRTALGVQTKDAFFEVQLENFQTFADIFDIKTLDDAGVETATKLHIATVQGMVRRVLDVAEPSGVPTVDTYDCIVVDECHRGYGLDQEMSEAELKLAEYGIRSQADYISRYRRILEHFDAVKIGLTATPAAHTKEIFGAPTFQYTYQEAVIDGCLVDHEPPFSLITKLAEEGIHWSKGEQVPLFDPQTLGIDIVDLDDEVDIEIEAFNRRVVTENFNRVVCGELARHIDPSDDAKTLIFAATDSHADMVVTLLKRAFREQYGEVEDDAVMKITGSVDKALQRIRFFKNERNPNVVVTVDLLTTGIDVPRISNLVFLRRVRSRILYEQMLGRATRLCPEIGKEAFRIFDAVALYEALEPVTQMKPVVAKPDIAFSDLVRELEVVDDPEARQTVLDQLIAKLQRKKQGLKGEALERFQSMAGMGPGELAKELRSGSPARASEWFKEHSFILRILEGGNGGGQVLLVSDHHDELRRVERGYGKGTKPEDYLEEFQRFVRENLNSMPALLVVAQRPRELTRAQLKQVALELGNQGYTERSLQTAWREKTNNDIAASIIGFIRQAALGDPLVAYEKRVDAALERVLASRQWTKPQRQWLERIAKQLKAEKVVDKAALDEGQFAAKGGYARLNKVFDGKLEEILTELGDGIWGEAG